MRLLHCLVAVSMTVFAGCDSEPVDPSPSVESVKVQATPQITFSPQQIEVGLNEEVSWDFQSVPHNVFFDDVEGRPSDIEGFNSNTSIERTFAAEGTFGYECRIHPGMRGTVLVSATSSAPGPG